MAEVFGQQAKREERVESYSQWAGATPVGDDGMVKQASGRGLNPAAVEQEVNTIRQTLKSGVSKVRLDISCEETIKDIKALLTPEELAKVVFGSEEFPTA